MLIDIVLERGETAKKQLILLEKSPCFPRKFAKHCRWRIRSTDDATDRPILRITLETVIYFSLFINPHLH